MTGYIKSEGAADPATAKTAKYLGVQIPQEYMDQMEQYHEVGHPERLPVNLDFED